MLSVNLYASYHITRALIPSMIKRKAGHIFNFSSTAGLQAYPNGGSYSISKWAMAGFSMNLREEMKEFNIKVTTVYPGATLTSSWDGFDIDPKRLMETSDIAKMIVAATKLSPQACVEEILIRPQLATYSSRDTNQRICTRRLLPNESELAHGGLPRNTF
jgi:NADP-dependent 3-hydroxy acid dehydrogenase YdfG